MNNINLIYAKSLNNVLGYKGRLPWNVPDDLKEFKQKTGNDTVVMGRKTFDSLPISVKPLPNRKNVIISNEVSSLKSMIPRCIVTNNFKELIETKDKNEVMWVIGGASILDLALPYVDVLHVTTIKIVVEGDVFSPEIDQSIFKIDNESDIKIDTTTGIEFYTTIYKRR